MESKELIAKNIAGEITLSSDSATALRKWREIFGIRQSYLADYLKISSSVISDYESGRRKSPGINFVKKIVEALIDIDTEKGGMIIKKFSIGSKSDAILYIRELIDPILMIKFLKYIDGKIVANKNLVSGNIRGYTVIDSIKAILEFTESEFIKIYGSTTERALIFTKVELGRSPMIAIKVTQPKPSLVVFHGPKPDDVDKLAIKIAKIEKIPLAVSTIRMEDELINRLRGLIK